ncbi:MAG: hypothetical protein NXI04_25865, partial [Planctomycetaceae bacterium]|nr:hypothetical protein [Planctomycetaceae bacterium]
MKRLMVGAAATVILLLNGGVSHAALFGLGGYQSCSTQACNQCGDFAAAKSGCVTGYRTVRDVVMDQQQYTCMTTVYDRCTECVPVPVTRNVYETRYRDECYTVCKPVYKTHYRCVQSQVCRPVMTTCYKTVTCNVKRPVYKTCYRDVCYNVCTPVYKTCYRNVCYNVCKPVY